MKMEKKREGWLDAVKTLAIFIVLLNHANVKLPGVNFWGGMFYVPVFFVLAGYTYRAQAEKYSSFIIKKAKRLLVPYFVANLFLLLFFSAKEFLLDGRLVTVTKNSIIGIFYARNQLFCMADKSLMTGQAPCMNDNVYFMNLLNAPTWFLPALFLSLVLFDGLMRLAKKDQKKLGLFVAVFLGGMVIYHYLCPYLLPWSLDAMPFFVALIQIGYVAKESRLLEKMIEQKKYRLMSVVFFVLFIGMALFNGSVNLSIGEYGKFMVAGLFNAGVSSLAVMAACYGLEHGFSKCFLPGWLVWPGRYTLTMLCYHLFIFLFPGGAITIFCSMLGVSTNVYITGTLKLVMVFFTIALFTMLGKGTDSFKKRKH